MTWTKDRYLFKNKGNFAYNYKLKKFEHMSKTLMQYDYKNLQSEKTRAQKICLSIKNTLFIIIV